MGAASLVVKNSFFKYFLGVSYGGWGGENNGDS